MSGTGSQLPRSGSTPSAARRCADPPGAGPDVRSVATVPAGTKGLRLRRPVVPRPCVARCEVSRGSGRAPAAVTADRRKGGSVRVLHVSEVTTGGVAAVLRSVVPGQIAAGHEVTVCMPTRLDAVPPEVFVVWGAQRRLSTVPAAVAEVRRVVERVRPEAVHLHAFGAGCLGRAAFLGRRGPAYDAAVLYQPHAW